MAQFISFAPGLEPSQRHVVVRGYESYKDSSVGQIVNSLRRILPMWNVRTFHPTSSQGTPFHYGLSNEIEIASLIKKYARQGYYTIVNETIDIGDGGVSGVALGGIMEFSPEDTPRAVEKPGVVSVDYSLGIQILKIIYGFAPEIPDRPDQRVEFSLHPNRVGYNKTHTLIWQLDAVGDQRLNTNAPYWPNRFSRFLGDKAYGLLIAHCLGFPVPKTVVISRKVAPFSFGKVTGTGDRWVRTCPPEPVPGKFTTDSKWRDPFALLQEEDPTGNLISSVISQDAVDARFSGVAKFDAQGQSVAGVSGQGDLFMQGRQPPEDLPAIVNDSVEAELSELESRLGPLSIEWVYDGLQVWVIQLHVFGPDHTESKSKPGRWLAFDPEQGLEALRGMVEHAKFSGEGIIVTRPVGITSHVGDILRRSGIPARFASGSR